MIEDEELLEDICGVVEPRKAAEAISFAFFHCVLKGLAKAPRICGKLREGAFTINDVHALVIPHICDTPTAREAERRGIPIITICQNIHLAPYKCHPNAIGAANALSAAGILLCLREGIDPKTVLRPLESITVS
jgi:hypothetical protein